MYELYGPVRGAAAPPRRRPAISGGGIAGRDARRPLLISWRGGPTPPAHLTKAAAAGGLALFLGGFAGAVFLPDSRHNSFQTTLIPNPDKLRECIPCNKHNSGLFVVDVKYTRPHSM